MPNDTTNFIQIWAITHLKEDCQIKLMIFQKRNDFRSHVIHMVRHRLLNRNKLIHFLDNEVKDKAFDISKEGKINPILL